MTLTAMDHPDFAPDTAPLEVLPRDLSAYRAGNTGVDYVHRFESGRPGPHVLINALTHGNEICGMVAATHLLDNAVRPKIGTLTVSFANIEAYEAFDLERPYENRQLVHNLNRIWTPELLDGGEQSPNCAARELRPVLDAADYILDIHSTRAPVQPFWVYYDLPRNAALATAVGAPEVQLVMPAERFPGTGVMGHGRHGDPQSDSGGAVVVECGQHCALGGRPGHRRDAALPGPPGPDRHAGLGRAPRAALHAAGSAHGEVHRLPLHAPGAGLRGLPEGRTHRHQRRRRDPLAVTTAPSSCRPACPWSDARRCT